MALFEIDIVLQCPPEAAFGFLVQPHNLQQVTDPTVGFKFVDMPEVLQLGTRFEFLVQGFGLPQRILHEIVEFDAPHRYVENQVRGPFRHWVHEHLFEAIDGAGVRVIDRIEFEPPTGLVGLLLTVDRIQETLEDGFEFRHRELKRYLEASSESAEL